MRAVLVFPLFEDREFTKDPGFVMHYLKGFQTEVWCTRQRQRRGFRPKIVSLGRPFLPRALLRLWYKARSIDALVLFHTHPLNLLYGPLYKLRNPHGVTYLKSDMDNTLLNLGKPSLLNYIRRIKLYLNLLHVDIFSTEQQAVLEVLKRRYPRFARKMIHVPNGYGDYTRIPHRPLDEKENVILTVGPVGSRQKGTDLIFKTLEQLDLKGWRVVIVGRVLDQKLVDDLFEGNPKLKGIVEFRGNISDRKEILALYDQAKLILMPSRWETFSCALSEAAHFGCVIIGTPVGGVSELTGKGRFGAVCPFESPDAYARELQKRMRNDKLRLREAKLTKENLDRNYRWEIIGERLAASLRAASGSRTYARAASTSGTPSASQSRARRGRARPGRRRE